MDIASRIDTAKIPRILEDRLELVAERRWRVRIVRSGVRELADCKLAVKTGVVAAQVGSARIADIVENERR